MLQTMKPLPFSLLFFLLMPLFAGLILMVLDSKIHPLSSTSLNAMKGNYVEAVIPQLLGK